jgi:hypothetical protein
MEKQSELALNIIVVSDHHDLLREREGVAMLSAQGQAEEAPPSSPTKLMSTANGGSTPLGSGEAHGPVGTAGYWGAMPVTVEKSP